MKMQHKLLWTIGPSNIILVYTMDTKDMQTEPQENSYLCPQYTLEKKQNKEQFPAWLQFGLTYGLKLQLSKVKSQCLGPQELRKVGKGGQRMPL